jgi:hypothetical protein
MLDRGIKIAEGTPADLREKVYVGASAPLEQVFAKLLEQ